MDKKYNYSPEEQQINKVLLYNKTESTEALAQAIDQRKDSEKIIGSSGDLLRSLGYGASLDNIVKTPHEVTPECVYVRSFEDLIAEADQKHPEKVCFNDFFTDEEIKANEKYISQLNEEFNAIHRLDKIDIIIPAVAGILGGVIDCFFGGFIKDQKGKSVPNSLSNWVRDKFDKALTPEKIKELEAKAKVTYDAANNSNTTIDVDGLSSYFHRHVSLGHDPILGFIFGVLDMLRGTMTTLDYKGNFVIQVMDNYSGRKAQNLFEAISKVFLHMLSDVNTPMGLPVPFMALFNNLQFGSIGEEKLNIAELVKGMYGQGYDFRHFCSMSIPVMITEVIVRVSYFAKRLSEGHSFKESIPVGLNREKKPKLATMLFIAHSAGVAINTGKVAFTKNPLNINYVAWLAFARYSIKQLKWSLYTKPKLRDKYVMDIINEEWEGISSDVESMWDEYTKDSVVVYI